MLILARFIGQTLVIGDDVTITVLCVNGDQVRFGIHAPNEIDIYREEVYPLMQNTTPPDYPEEN